MIRLALPLAGLVAGGLWMAGGSAKATLEFELPAKDLAKRLSESARTVEGTGMGSLKLAGFGLDPRKVQISVSRAGSPNRVKCTVQVTEQGKTHSSASLDCTQTGAGTEAMNRIGGEAMAIVVSEHIRATALSQPYDTDAVADRMLAFMARNAPVMAARIRPPDAQGSSASH